MRFECRLVCLKMFRAMSKEVKAALNLLCLRTGGPCQRSCAPTASPVSSSLREIGPGHGYSTNKTLRFSNMLLGHNVGVTAVPILATDDYIFPGHTELHDDASRWRFHVVVSSSLPLGACCLLWYTQQANDSRSVSPVALCLGLRDVDGNPIRGNVYAAARGQLWASESCAYATRLQRSAAAGGARTGARRARSRPAAHGETARSSRRTINSTTFAWRERCGVFSGVLR